MFKSKKNISLEMVVSAANEIYKNNWEPTLELFSNIHKLKEAEQLFIIEKWITQLTNNMDIYYNSYYSYYINNKPDFANIKQEDILISAEYARNNKWTKSLELFNSIVSLPIEIQINIIDFWYGTYSGIV